MFMNQKIDRNILGTVLVNAIALNVLCRTRQRAISVAIKIRLILNKNAGKDAHNVWRNTRLMEN